MSVPRSVSKRTNGMPGGDDLDRHDVLAAASRRVDREEHVARRPGPARSASNEASSRSGSFATSTSVTA